jgi:GNAT superfamily N-acetyltransferase
MERRNYCLLKDFEKVRSFLAANCGAYGQHMRLPEFWEYAHVLLWYDYPSNWRNALWEEDGALVAAAWYEMERGTAYLTADPAHESLFAEMLDYAEQWLCRTQEDGARSLTVEVYPGQDARRALLLARGYVPDGAEEWNLYPFTKPIPEPVLPEGFSILRLSQVPEGDLQRVVDAVWQGFDHEGSGNLEGFCMTMHAPHARPDLTRCVVAPNGDYACYAGLWLNQDLGYAYLEPLCTHPKYRRLGLARAVLYTQMREAKALGARFITGGEDPFYHAIGYETQFRIEKLTKRY